MFSDAQVLQRLQRYFYVDSTQYPWGYSQHYRLRDRGTEIDDFEQFDPEIQHQVHLVSAVLDFAITQPLQFAIAISDTEFKTSLHQQLTQIPLPLRTSILLRQSIEDFMPNLFTFNELYFDLDLAAQMIAQNQREAVSIDFTQAYPRWVEEIDTDLFAEPDSVIIAQLPRSIGTHLPISGWETMAQLYRETNRVQTPAYFLSLRESEACLLSEHLRPLWIFEQKSELDSDF